MTYIALHDIRKKEQTKGKKERKKEGKKERKQERKERERERQRKHPVRPKKQNEKEVVMYFVICPGLCK